MPEAASTATASPLLTAIVHAGGTPSPPWAARVEAHEIDAGALDGTSPRGALADVGCVLLDATALGALGVARRIRQADANVQVVAVTPAEQLQATRRALLFAPGLGEVWVAAPMDVTRALTERAAGVTRQRRRFERTRARIERERIAASPQRAERALISDAYLAGLLRVLPDPVFSVDAAGRVLSANDVAERTFGTERDLTGMRLVAVLGLEPGGEDERALLDRAVAEGQVLLRFRRSDGTIGSGELRASAMSLQGSQAWAVLLRDVSEQHATYERLRETAMELEAANEELQVTTEELLQRTEEAEQGAAALRESEATYRALVDAIPTLAWTARADGYIDWYNQRWYEYTGTTPREIVGWGWRSVHDPAVVEEVTARWRASITSGAPFEMTFPLRGADGTYRSFLTRVVPLHDERGRVIRWFGTNTDVEIERLSRTRVERLQSLTEALAATRTLDDVASVVVAQAVNATGAQTGMLAMRPPGADEAVIVRQTGLHDAVVRRNDRFPITAPGPAAECLRTGEAIFVESRQGPGGLIARYPGIVDVFDALRTHALATVPLAAAGEVVGTMSFTFTTPRQFTAEDRAFFLSLGRQCAQAVERARLFAAERAARERADEANRAKSQFLATMSHELRTPLNAISGHVGLVLEEIYGPVTADQRAALDRVTRAQKHLLGLINEVLSFARLESGRVEYRVEPVDTTDLVGSVLPLVELQLTRKGLSLEVHLPEQRGEQPVVVMADRDKLGQVLVNLLSNAIKFTEPGGRIVVDVGRSKAGTARISVRDTGIGIPPDKLDSIFEPFVQVRADLTRTREGTGLGLAISRDLARGMGGDVVVESAVGAGSTFTIQLPASDRAADG